MISLEARALSFAYTDAVPVLDAVDLHLTAGWTGVVGPNGAGKTTLLRLLSGDLAPTSGRVLTRPEWALVRYVAQTVEAPDEEVLLLADAEDGLSRRLRGQLRLDPAELTRWPTLSPGERKRWQIGAALAAEPDVLLLDEPTNHLDAAARALLLDALRPFRGVGLVVSHDRALLEALTTATLRLDPPEARLWPGAYDAARAAWQAESDARLAALEASQRAEAATRRRLDEARRDRESAQRQRSAKHRMKDRNDSDARSMGADFRAATAEKRLGRQVGVARRAADRAADERAEHAWRAERGGAVRVAWEPPPVPWLCVLERLPDDLPISLTLDASALQLGRADRVRIEGPNGAGKTTLVRALLAASRVPAERLLVLPQELTADEAAAWVTRTRALPPDARGRVLSLASHLGADPDRLLATDSPSPGEARKLALAHGLAHSAWALVLDEPTNHLDLPSIERIEAALAEWPGALVLVSHDARFAARLTTTAWRVDDGRVSVVSASASG